MFSTWKAIVIVLFVLISTCYGDLPVEMPVGANAVPHVTAITSAASMCNNKTAGEQKKTFGLQFRAPFMDMEIRNQHNLHIIQEPLRRHLFVLHGNELYQMFVSREEKYLSLVGLLDGSVKEEEPLSAEVIVWHNYLLMAIALDEYLEIYQLPEQQLQQNAELSKRGKLSKESAPSFEPIQQLALTGKYRQLFLISPQQDQVLLIAAVNFTKLYGKLRTFEWANTYFDLIEEITVPPIHVLSVIGTQPKYLVSGRTIKHQSKTVLNIYEVQLPGMNLLNRQTLTVTSRTVHAATFRGKNYLIACANQQNKCNSFRMTDGQFSVYKQRTGKELAFEKLVAGTHFLVGSRLNVVMVFTSGRLDCFGSFTANETGVSSTMVHVNEHDEHFVLLTYKRPFHTLVRMVEVETEGGKLLGVMSNETEAEDLGTLRNHQHMFEDTIGQLRSLLLQRKTAMDVFRNVAAFMKPKVSSLKVKNAVRLRAGKIGLVKLVGPNLRSPIQLLDRVEEMTSRYRRTRFVRSTQPPENVALDVPLHLKVRLLRVDNLLFNGSIMEGLYFHNSTKNRLPIRSIRMPVTTRILTTQHLLTRQGLRGPRQNTADNLATFKARDLIVQRINDVPVADFLKSLFLKNRDAKIEGRLVLQVETSVVNMWAPLLNGLVVAELFNLKQPQVVSSEMLIKGFSVSDLRSEQVNGLNFAEDIVFRGRDEVIKTPIDIHRMSVVGDLFMAYTPKLGRAADMESPQLQQFYTAKVIIDGSLTINNLVADDVAPSVINVDRMPFSVDVLKRNYLLKNSSQTFTSAVQFGNTKVTTPAFITNYVDGHSTEQHLLTTGHPHLQKPLLLIFMQAEATGDVVCADYRSKVLELNSEAVRFGDIANITGLKLFAAPLKVFQLMTLELNNLPVNELVLKSQLKQDFEFKGVKSFDKVMATDVVYVDEMLNCSYLNSLPTNELLSYEYYFESLQVPYQLQAKNVVFHKINGLSSDDVFAKFDVDDERLVLRKNLIIEGNVHFGGGAQVETVNDLRWNEYLRGLVRLNENAQIYGQKEFRNDVIITGELKTPFVNGANMHEVFNSVLSKSKPQLITGAYSFDSLHLSNVDVSVVNGVPTASFIDTRRSSVIIEGDVIVPKIAVQGNVRGRFMHRVQMDGLSARLQALINKQWRNLVVLGNSFCNETSFADRTQHEQLQYLHKNAVRHQGHQVITGNMRLRRPLIRRMQAKTKFPRGIDLDFIVSDCLLKHTTVPQIIHGHKTLLKSTHLENVEAHALVNATLLNGVDVLRLNASLYRVSSGNPIGGPLHFKTPPIVGHLVVAGMVNGINTKNIYHSPINQLPPLKIRSLVIEHALQVQDINNMNLDYLLENRVTLSGQSLEIYGFLTFEQLVLNKETLLQSINGIPIDNLVFKQSSHLQALTGAKLINGDLELTGPAHVQTLNGHDLVDSFQRSIFTGHNYHFDSLVLNQGTFVKGLVLIRDVLSSDKNRASAPVADSQWARQQTQLVDILDTLEKVERTSADADRNQSHHLIYLDFDFKTEVLQQPANETIDKTFFYNLKHSSMCEHGLLQVQRSELSRRIFVTNATTNFITAQMAGRNVKAQNYCEGHYRKVKSKITLNGRTFAKVFGMKKFIENIEIFMFNETQVFLLLHAIDPERNRNEVRVLRIDDNRGTVSDWQSVRLGLSTTMRLFKFPNYVVMISAALVNNQPAVITYDFSYATQQFKLMQIIHGAYDIMEVVAVQPARYQLILSCRSCQRINIYERDAVESFYRIFQILKLKTHIDRLFSFRMSDNSLYVLVLAAKEHDFYHLYKYSHIQGWLHSTYGYFRNIQMALPLSGEVLEPSGNGLLLLLCGGGRGGGVGGGNVSGAGESGQCSLVKAFAQP